MEVKVIGEAVPIRQLKTPRARGRAINDDIIERTRAGSTLGIGLVGCECGRERCLEAVQVEFDDYDRFRSRPTWSILACEHVRDGAEVVMSTSRFAVIDERLQYARPNGNGHSSNGHAALSTQPGRILIVDDSEVMRKLCSTVLTLAGHVVLEAADGREGLARAQSERPDLVLTDVSMPELGGLELVEALRRDERTRDIRLIVMSGSLGPSEARRAHRLGAAAVLAKPFQPAFLSSLVAQVLSANGRSGQMELNGANA